MSDTTITSTFDQVKAYLQSLVAYIGAGGQPVTVWDRISAPAQRAQGAIANGCVLKDWQRETPARQAAGDFDEQSHDKGQTLYTILNYGRPTGTPDNPVDPNQPVATNFGWSYDADVVRARAKNGVNQAGETIALEETLRRHQQWDEYGATGRLDPDLEETLYKNATISKIYPTDPGMWMTDITEYVDFTLQGKLDQWKMLAGYGPSGGDDPQAPGTGPGVVA